MRARRRAGRRGFTLIELMVAVAVIGVLGAVAYPSYLGQIAKSRRSDAKTALLATAQSLERYYSERATYAGATLGAGCPGNAAAPSCIAPAASGNGYYTIAITTQTAAGFTLQATPAGAQAGDACGSYTYDQTGTKGVTGALAPASCW
ncbi:MAG: type IV pilin protein [Burkholderiales bacterium]|nr:type IV pilin protein [Burkholderiales bacterium]MDE1926861.1 type IV pilin protein [Burkholderiales bacterium]MDE2504709.1 type IV pilin protein [Burkholderiales bacterium]